MIGSGFQNIFKIPDHTDLFTEPCITCDLTNFLTGETVGRGNGRSRCIGLSNSAQINPADLSLFIPNISVC